MVAKACAFITDHIAKSVEPKWSQDLANQPDMTPGTQCDMAMEMNLDSHKFGQKVVNDPDPSFRVTMLLRPTVQMIWRLPWGYPQIIHLRVGFSINHPAMGVPFQDFPISTRGELVILPPTSPDFAIWIICWVYQPSEFGHYGINYSLL